MRRWLKALVALALIGNLPVYGDEPSSGGEQTELDAKTIKIIDGVMETWSALREQNLRDYYDEMIRMDNYGESDSITLENQLAFIAEDLEKWNEQVRGKLATELAQFSEQEIDRVHSYTTSPVFNSVIAVNADQKLAKELEKGYDRIKSYKGFKQVNFRKLSKAERAYLKAGDLENRLQSTCATMYQRAEQKPMWPKWANNRCSRWVSYYTVKAVASATTEQGLQHLAEFDFDPTIAKFRQACQRAQTEG